MNSWKAFSASYWLWKHFPCKNLSRCLKKWVCWQEVKWIWQMKQNFIAQFIPFLKWFCDLQSGIFVQNWAHSVENCGLHLHLIDLLSILLRHNSSQSCSGSDRQQTTKQWSWPFLVQVWVWLWEVLWSFFPVQTLNWCLPVTIYNPLFATCYNLIKKPFIIVCCIE